MHFKLRQSGSTVARQILAYNITADATRASFLF